MNNFIKHLQKTFRTDTKKGRALFIFATYFLYWFVFFGLWILLFGGLKLFSRTIISIVKITEVIPSLLKAYFIFFKTLVNLDTEPLAVFFFLLAPILIVIPARIIQKTVTISKQKLWLYSLAVMIISIMFIYVAIFGGVASGFGY